MLPTEPADVPTSLERDGLHPEVEYFASTCGSCGRRGTVTREKEIGQLCVPCATVWSRLSSMAFCSCPALWGHHALSCTVRIRDRAS